MHPLTHRPRAALISRGLASCTLLLLALPAQATLLNPSAEDAGDTADEPAH